MAHLLRVAYAETTAVGREIGRIAREVLLMKDDIYGAAATLRTLDPDPASPVHAATAKFLERWDRECLLLMSDVGAVKGVLDDVVAGLKAGDVGGAAEFDA